MLSGDLLQVDELRASTLGDEAGLGFAVVPQERLCVHSDDSSVLLRYVNSNSLLVLHRTALSNCRVDNKTTRRLNLEGLIGESETIAKLAKLHDLNESLLSQIRTGKRNVGDKLARKIEENVGKPTGWMDVPHFKSADLAVEYAELMHIYDSLNDKDREAWIALGRSLSERGPRGPNNPFGQIPRPKGPKKGTQ